jgi:insulysin
MLPNQLDVLMVSDARFKKSSAAMAVAVGSLEDPDKAQGMAHYLEHMLFLGTKEFPKADEYSTYMEVNGGWDNAYTSDEVTNYMFEVDNQAIDGALHRFSRFFTSPLFDATYIEREKNAVNSEFEKNIKQDGWRIDRYIATLARPDHPYRKFSTGNTSTLRAVTRDDVVSFYKKYYSANNMKLVVMSSEPLSTIRAQVIKYFSSIPNFNATKPTYSEFYFDPALKQRLHFVKTINDKEEMTILFNVPDETQFWKSKPLAIISKLFGDEGPGSALSLLKKEGLALEMAVSENFWRTLSVDVTLTPKGRKNYQRVLGVLEGYLQHMRKQQYPEYIFKDESAVRKIALDNLEPSSSGQRAASFAKSLIDFPASDFLARNYLIQEYSVKDFQHFLSFLDFRKAHVLILGKNEKTNQKESIFGVEYRQEKLTLPEFKDAKAQLALKYPQENKYIPTDFSLIGNKRVLAEPQMKKAASSPALFVRTDTELGVAKATVRISLQGHSTESARDAALLVLFVMGKEEEMREWSYPISEAGAQFVVSTGEIPREMVITVSGYSQRLKDIFRDGIGGPGAKRQLEVVNLSKASFDDMKQRFVRDLANLEEAVAANRLGIEARHMQNAQSVHWKELLKEVRKIQLKDVQTFSAKYFSKISIRVMAYGNIDMPTVESMLSLLPRADGNLEKQKYRVVPDQKIYSGTVTGQNNNHAMFTVYNMAPWSVENHARALVLGQLVSQPYFSELRTNQQLGYVARANGIHQGGFVGLNSLLQSPKVPSVTLQEKSHEFLRQFLQGKLTTLTDAELKPILSSIENELLMKPTTLQERESEFFQAAAKYEGRFTIRQDIAKEVKKLNAQQMKTFIQEHFLSHPPATVSLFYFGSGTKVDKKKLPGSIFEKTNDVTWDVINPYVR